MSTWISAFEMVQLFHRLHKTSVNQDTVGYNFFAFEIGQQGVDYQCLKTISKPNK